MEATGSIVDYRIPPSNLHWGPKNHAWGYFPFRFLPRQSKTTISIVNFGPKASILRYFGPVYHVFPVE